MSKLNSTIQALVTTFAADIVKAIRDASLGELLEVGKAPARSAALSRAVPSKGRRLRSKVTVEAIVGVLRQHAAGLRSAQLRKALGGVSRGTWRHSIEKAISGRKVRMRGTRSAAVYFAA
jgi:hypothetical protein